MGMVGEYCAMKMYQGDKVLLYSGDGGEYCAMKMYQGDKVLLFSGDGGGILCQDVARV